MTEFTPITSFLGGGLIGLSAVLLMLTQGRIAGISGIVSQLLPPAGDRGLGGRISFILGLIAAPLLVMAITGQTIQQTVSSDMLLMIAAGLLVGFGSVWGNGCTSGHGVCGLSRLSVRSLVATLVFMATGFITVFVVRHVLGA